MSTVPDAGGRSPAQGTLASGETAQRADQRPRCDSVVVRVLGFRRSWGLEGDVRDG